MQPPTRIKQTPHRHDWSEAVGSAEALVLSKGSVINPTDLLGDDLKLITDNIRRLLGSGHPVLTTVSAYYFGKRGKHVRPLVVLLVAQAAQSNIKRINQGITLLIFLTTS
jgi:hexaprenyl-diphosphate synthase